MAFRARKRWSDPQAPAWKVTFNDASPPGSTVPRLLSLGVEPALPPGLRLHLLPGDLLQGPDDLVADLPPDVLAVLPVVGRRARGKDRSPEVGLLDLVDEPRDGALLLRDPEVADAGPCHLRRVAAAGLGLAHEGIGHLLHRLEGAPAPRRRRRPSRRETRLPWCPCPPRPVRRAGRTGKPR